MRFEHGVVKEHGTDLEYKKNKYRYLKHFNPLIANVSHKKIKINAASPAEGVALITSTPLGISSGWL